jgi:non-ribosomal peptide synthase protein (TIGR01720 family)
MDYDTESALFSDSNTIETVLSETDTDMLLKKSNRAYNTEINDLLLAALGLTICEWSGRQNILIKCEGHGRESIIDNIDISRTVGWFTSAYPVIINVHNPLDISGQIISTKETIRHIPNKGVGYGILRYLTDNDNVKQLEFSLAPEISFNYLGQIDQSVNNNIFRMSSLTEDQCIGQNNKMTSKVNINCIVVGKKLRIYVTYNKKQYFYNTISVLIERYKYYLLAIIEHCLQKDSIELTPSDFEEYDISMDDFNYIIRNVSSSEIGYEVSKMYPLSPMQQGMLFYSL